MQIIFLFQTAEHVRFRKRVELLMDQGFDAAVLAFERGSYPMASLPCRYASLGSLAHRNYMKRIMPFIGAVGKIRAAAKNSSVLYCFGLDMLLLGWLASLGRKKVLVYEVGDIREVLTGSGLKAALFRGLERFLAGRVGLLVVTSPAFVQEYFHKYLGLQDTCYQVVENKLDQKWLKGVRPGQDRKEAGVLRVGYFGVLRCRRSWDILEAAAKSGRGKIEVYVRGISRDIDLKKAEAQEHITYGGPYVSPDQLAELYGSVDLVWACYPYQAEGAGNWQWAKTIRFYEACYFKKPLIVQAGTEDSRLVEKYEIGLVVDMGEHIETVAGQLQGITGEELQRWTANLKSLPQEIYLYTDEHRVLAENLRDLARG